MKILLALLLVGCTASQSAETESKSKYQLKCEGVGQNMMRCENSEVVCYMSVYTGGRVDPSCQRK